MPSVIMDGFRHFTTGKKKKEKKSIANGARFSAHHTVHDECDIEDFTPINTIWLNAD